MAKGTWQAIPLGEVTLVPTTRGQWALIDTADLPIVQGHSWSAQKGKGHRTFYARAREGLMHRVILGYGQADPDIDHINHNGLDNRRANLRSATPMQNGRNKRSHVGSSSRFMGVTWRRDNARWAAQIGYDGTNHGLGCYDTEEEAARAYDLRAREIFGEFAHLNFPEHLSPSDVG